jgi:hypothetical protein
MGLFGKALDRIADWVVGDKPITFSEQRIHHYERLNQAINNRGYGDPL